MEDKQFSPLRRWPIPPLVETQGPLSPVSVMQYDPFRQRSNQGVHYVEHSYCRQDTATIEQLRRERQPLLIITIVSPELHFDAAVGLCIEGTISEVRDA